MIKTGKWDIALKAIKQHQNIIIFHHINPDGDCLGSQFGLAELIRTNYPNKRVFVIGDNKGNFDFMNYQFNSVRQIDFTNSLAIVVDTPVTDRIEKSDLFLNNKFSSRLKIDHHPNVVGMPANYEWTDARYVAAAEMIAELASKANWTINHSAAQHLYLGILTDSGRFMYSSTTPRTYKLVAKLIKSGNLDINSIHNNLYKKSLVDLKIQSEVMNGFKQYERVLYFVATRKIQAKLNVSEDRIAMQVNTLSNIENNLVWIFFVEQSDGSYRVRLRSSGPIINKIAQKFNGGGHEQASGATIFNKRDILKIVKRAQKAIDKWESK